MWLRTFRSLRCPCCLTLTEWSSGGQSAKPLPPISRKLQEGIVGRASGAVIRPSVDTMKGTTRKPGVKADRVSNAEVLLHLPAEKIRGTQRKCHAALLASSILRQVRQDIEAEEGHAELLEKAIVELSTFQTTEPPEPSHMTAAQSSWLVQLMLGRANASEICEFEEDPRSLEERREDRAAEEQGRLAN